MHSETFSVYCSGGYGSNTTSLPKRVLWWPHRGHFIQGLWWLQRTTVSATVRPSKCDSEAPVRVGKPADGAWRAGTLPCQVLWRRHCIRPSTASAAELVQCRRSYSDATRPRELARQTKRATCRSRDRRMHANVSDTLVLSLMKSFSAPTTPRSAASSPPAC